ncbi:MAG: adenylate cyclase [Pseudomonadota bacterium]
MNDPAEKAEILNGEEHRESRPKVQEIRDAVARLNASKGLSGSRRLKGFLEYVVEETLAGRGDAIRAKTLAMDVYHYPADQVIQRENVIRVDAGRLRRRMSDYYKGAGQTDPLEIVLPKGSYTPEFKLRVILQPAKRSPLSRQTFLLVTGLGSILVVLLASMMLSTWLDETPDQREVASSDNSNQKRTAIFETSPARLQAVNLAAEGRDLIFPAIEPNRLRAALLVFESAIALDHSYFGGFAGAAQIHALVALVSNDPDIVETSLVQATERANQAAALSPESAWSQSALSMVEFARRDWDEAKSLSDRAMKLDPDDPHLVEFDALISLFSGDFDRVLAVVGEVMKSDTGDSGFVFENALGSAKFHTGDFEGAVQTFEDAIAGGAPTGPVSVAYLMAAHYRLGNDAKAKELAGKYREISPQQGVEVLFSRLFKNPDDADQLAQAINGAKRLLE